MQNTNVMIKILNDTIWYFPRPSIKNVRDIGTFASYDLAAYDCFKRDFVAIIPDATSDRNLALRMCERFNRYQLSPTHLKEAIIDMLD